MEPVHSIRPVLAIAVSLACTFLILAHGKHRNLREFWSILGSTSKFLVVLSMFPFVLAGGVYIFEGPGIAPGISLDFRADAFSIFFSSLSSFLWILTTVYSIGYMRALEEHRQTRYFFFFGICVASTVGIAHANNLFTLFIFYELLTLATYPLVIHKETPEAMKAGRKYLAYTLTGGVVILLGMVWTYYLAGTLTFADHGFLSGHGSPEVLRVLFMIFIIGFGVKAAIMPLHAWLPTAMVAPTPVSALLHAVAVVKAGVFGIIRIIYCVFGAELSLDIGVGLPLAIVASFTIIVASIFALAQDNLKLRLAYSTISQLAYIILGAALLSPYGLTGGMVHITHQAFMKITLFFCAGAILVQTGKKNISEMDGIGKKMPLTMAAFAIAAVGMMGIPPTCGFISKWYLCLGAIEAGYPIFLLVILVSALLNAAYFMPPIYSAFFKEPDASFKDREPSWWLLAPILICAAISLILGIVPMMPNTPLQLVLVAVHKFIGGGV
ncbi:MAG: monovalent cation/H+ antiporter subunit D family protein [Methanosarcinales archaeon Met12]|nr:MAG: monovalent cation/H+ antiporter subunit D family protein [Methanosarcinales archaeon Met12]